MSGEGYPAIGLSAGKNGLPQRYTIHPANRSVCNMKLTVSRAQLAPKFVPIDAPSTHNARIICKIDNRLISRCTKGCASRLPGAQSEQNFHFQVPVPLVSFSAPHHLTFAELSGNVVIYFLRCAKLCSLPGFCGKLTQTWDRLRSGPDGDLVSRFFMGLRAGRTGVPPRSVRRAP